MKMSINPESIPSRYPAPKTQELSLLARKIQELDNLYVRNEYRKNPRLLSSSTDTPTILQEGFRYNALHVAARFGNLDAAQLILSTINGASHMKLLYPDDPNSIREERTKYLTDMFLNSPDKGASETPLHFACKFGYYEVAKLLVGHPLCDMSLKNRDNKTAQEVIGTRATESNAGNEERISKLFRDIRIVPIWRDLTNHTAPVVGRPVNPKYLGEHTPKIFTTSYGDVAFDLFGPVDTSCIPKPKLGVRWEIRAFAGPTDEETAALFYEAMKCKATVTYAALPDLSPSGGSPDFNSLYNEAPKTPSRQPEQRSRFLRKSMHITPSGTSSPMFTAPVRRTRDDCYTPERRTPKDPYSSSLPSPKDLEYTSSTLSLLLTSPARLSTPTRMNPSRMLEDRRLRGQDPEKGFERVGRKHSSELRTSWFEFWTFLGEFVDLSSDSGLVLLEDYLYRGREDQLAAERQRNSLKPSAPATPITAMCSVMKNLNLGSVRRIPKRKEAFQDWRNRLNIMHYREPKDPSDTMTPSPNTLSKLLGISNGGGRTFNAMPSEKVKEFKLGIRKLFPPVEPAELKSNGNSKAESKPPGRTGNQTSESDSEEDACSTLTWRTPHSQNSSFESACSSMNTTVTSDSGSEEEFEDCQTYSLYLNGSEPSKEDFQAMRAIAEVVENLSPEKFPEITAWYNCLMVSGIKK